MSWRGAISKNLQELRFHVCKESKGSEGLRDFITKTYAELKKANPVFPFLVREKSQGDAAIVARYDFGVEETVVVENMSTQQIATQLEELVKKGDHMARSTESL